MSYPRTKEEWLALFSAAKSGDPAAAIAFDEACTAFGAACSNHTADSGDRSAYLDAVAEASPSGKRLIAEGLRPLMKSALENIAESLSEPDQREEALQTLARLGVDEDRLPELLKLSNDDICALLEAQRAGGAN